MTDVQKSELWQRWRNGESISDISRALAADRRYLSAVAVVSGALESAGDFVSATNISALLQTRASARLGTNLRKSLNHNDAKRADLGTKWKIRG